MIDHDQLFKKLLTTFFIEFMRLFFPQVMEYLDSTFYEPLDKEIFTAIAAATGEEYEADLLVKTRFKNEQSYFAVHIENQSSYKSGLEERMFWYVVRLMEKYHYPIYPIIVYSFDTPLAARPNFYSMGFPDLEVLRLNFQTVQLNRLQWRDYLTSKNPVAIALMTKMNVAPEDRVAVKLACLRMLLGLKLSRAKRNLISSIVDTYTDLTPAEEQEFEQAVNKLEPVKEKEKIMELTTSWKREGIKEGKQQGIEQGKQQGEATMLLQMLNYKLGKLTPKVSEQVKKLPEEKLQALGLAFFGFSSITDLADWLEQNG